MKGLTDGVFFERLRALGLDAPESDEELSGRLLEIMLRILPGKAQAFARSRETVLELAGERRTALATSSRRALADAALDLLELAGVFEVVVTREDVSRGKPDPEPFLITARKLGLAPERCVVVEDSVNGVESAVGAGAACIAVEHSFPASALGAADLVVPAIADVGAAVHALEASDWRSRRAHR
jgi:HAD superfamily hydrolase (TIGR01509 family)